MGLLRIPAVGATTPQRLQIYRYLLYLAVMKLDRTILPRKRSLQSQLGQRVAPLTVRLQPSLQVFCSMSDKAAFFEGMYDQERAQNSRLKDELIALQKEMRDQQSRLQAVLPNCSGQDVVRLVTSEIAVCRAQAQSDREAIFSLREEMQSLEEEKKQLDRQYENKLDMELRLQRMKEDELRRRMKAQLEQFQRLSEGASRQLRSREQELRSLDGLLRAKEAMLEERRNEETRLRLQLQNSSQKYKEMIDTQTQLQVLKIRSVQTEAEERLASLQKQNEQKIQKMETQCCSRVAVLEVRCQESDLSLQLCRKQQREQAIAVKQQLDDALAESHLLKLSLAQNQCKLSSVQIERYQLRIQLIKKKEDNQRIRQQNEQVRKLLEESQAEAERLRRALKGARTQRDNFSFQCNKKQQRITRLEEEVRSLAQARQKKVREVREAAEKQCSQIELEKAELQEQLGLLAGQRAREQELQMCLLEEAKAELKQTKFKGEVKLKESRRAAQRRYEQYEQMLKELQERGQKMLSAALEDKQREGDKRLNKLNLDKNQQREKEVRRLAQRIEKETKRGDDLQRQVEQLQGRIEREQSKRQSELQAVRQSIDQQVERRCKRERQETEERKQQEKRNLVLAHIAELAGLNNEMKQVKEEAQEKLQREARMSRQQLAQLQKQSEEARIRDRQEHEKAESSLLALVKKMEGDAAWTSRQLIVRVQKQCEAETERTKQQALRESQTLRQELRTVREACQREKQEAKTKFDKELIILKGRFQKQHKQMREAEQQRVQLRIAQLLAAKEKEKDVRQADLQQAQPHSPCQFCLGIVARVPQVIATQVVSMSKKERKEQQQIDNSKKAMTQAVQLQNNDKKQLFQQGIVTQRQPNQTFVRKNQLHLIKEVKEVKEQQVQVNSIQAQRQEESQVRLQSRLSGLTCRQLEERQEEPQEEKPIHRAETLSLHYYMKELEEARNKVKRAGQVVCYLQLQLQNYKEAYAMFGPRKTQHLELPRVDRQKALYRTKMKQRVEEIVIEGRKKSTSVKLTEGRLATEGEDDLADHAARLMTELEEESKPRQPFMATQRRGEPRQKEYFSRLVQKFEHYRKSIRGTGTKARPSLRRQ